MDIVSIAADKIHRSTQAAQIDEDRVSELMDSISRVGLINPISIYKYEFNAIYIVVAGNHRLAALKRLGWSEVPCIVVEIPELQRRMVTVDENLVRAALSPLDRADLLLRRKLIFEEMYPETRRGGDRRSEKFKSTIRPSENFATDTAEKIGTSRVSVQRAVRRAELIADDVKATIKGTALETGVVLDALTSLPVEQQREVAEHVRQGDLDAARQIIAPAVEQEQAPEASAEPARALNVVQMPGGCTQLVRRQLNRLQKAWDESCEETHERFRRRLEKRRAKATKADRAD